jgi:glycerol-3-phosphate dehydrogenase (NAD(P)+)
VRRLAIIGGGAWGTALAVAAHRAGSRPIIWARDRSAAVAINDRHENASCLPGVALDPDIAATSDIGAALADAEAGLLAIPAQSLRGVLVAHRHAFRPGFPILHCAKGIEVETLAMMSDVGVAVLPASPFAVLSGPSFAAEVASDLPTAVVIAGPDAPLAHAFVSALGSPRFRPYLSQDALGVQIGGAVKNVIAIACGIVFGQGLGENARAALITRGLAEIVRLGCTMGARADTFQGLAGFGDLVLSCTAPKSRNYRLGLALGRSGGGGVIAGSGPLVEGVATAAAVVRLAARLHIEMPISEAVVAVLHDGAPIDEMIDRLLRRPFRSE